MSERKQRLTNRRRHTLPIRLESHEHSELVNVSNHESRSMAFIALRRYKIGKAIEISHEPQDTD